jgi:hypothetical protein
MYAGHFDFQHPLLWTVDALLSPDECRAILERHADAEWLAGTVNRLEGRAVDTVIRDNATAIVREPALAQDLYQRLRPHLPATMRDDGRSVAVRGLNLPLRIYRYDPGQHFGPHQDQSYAGPGGTSSLLTFLVYLNHDFEGGGTTFLDEGRTVVPCTGTALLFQHKVLHAGERVLRGTKYVLRTDVLYGSG